MRTLGILVWLKYVHVMVGGLEGKLGEMMMEVQGQNLDGRSLNFIWRQQRTIKHF